MVDALDSSAFLPPDGQHPLPHMYALPGPTPSQLRLLTALAACSVWAVIALCVGVLILLASIGIHLKTVELPRRTAALKKDVLNKYA